jgi:GntR family transcriptional regulator
VPRQVWPPTFPAMEINIDRGSPTPPHLQVADYLRRQIERGRIEPGRRIPSVLELAEATGLARETIRKATNKLKDEGLLYNVNGLGLFVTDPQDRA